MAVFSEETLKLKPIPNKDLVKSGKILHGEEAIRAVEQMEGRTLSPAERRVVMLEGFVPVPYLDSVGNKTIGVGQTGKFMRQTFSESFNNHVDKIKKKVKKFDTLPDFLQTELIQSAYRGGILLSPKTLGLINQGNFSDAAIEFLDNAEFRKKSTKPAIKKRMLALSDALAATSTEDDELSVIQRQLPQAETSQPTPDVSTAETNTSETGSQAPSELTAEEEAFITDYVDNIKGSAQEGLDRAVAEEQKPQEQRLAAAAQEAEAKFKSLTPEEDAFINSFLEQEGEAGMAERLAAEEEQGAEDARLDNLF